ncbi:hypothetical protein KP509_22G005200 [Ceratopteris richardii]|uniref:Uncharacterized protein n=1 Tax=Ceratopteris richardii TaxID=49495 RepID=A0A8T2S4D4_CERRI|nr:hypothetical protein KP509_22G005200 [Ceratopteris richardii]
MSETSLQDAGRLGKQLQGQAASSAIGNSFRQMDGGRSLAPPQASIATRSYSDIGPHSIAKLGAFYQAEKFGDGTAYVGGTGVGGGLRAGGAMKVEVGQNPVGDALFFQQYNKLYGMMEEEKGAPGYYACSNGGREVGRGGAGSWSLRLDPEVKRRGRLASYRAISFEAKMKSSVKKSFKWVKERCASLVSRHQPHPAATAPMDPTTTSLADY